MQIFPVLLLFLCTCSVFWGTSKFNYVSYSVKQIIASWYPSYEDDGKLKFVSNNSEELVSGGKIKYVIPVEVLSLEEIDGKILIKTHEISPVKCPLDCNLVVDNGIVYINYKKIKISFEGFGVVGVKSGENAKAGTILGTLSGDSLLCEIYLGNKKIGLEEIKAYLWKNSLKHIKNCHF